MNPAHVTTNMMRTKGSNRELRNIPMSMGIVATQVHLQEL